VEAQLRPDARSAHRARNLQPSGLGRSLTASARTTMWRRRRPGLAVPEVHRVPRWPPPPRQHPQLQQVALDAGQALAVSNEPGTARLQKATRQPRRHQPPTEWRPNDSHPALCGIGSASMKATLGIQQRVLGAIKAGAVLHAGQHTSCWSTPHNMHAGHSLVRTYLRKLHIRCLLCMHTVQAHSDGVARLCAC
jgi:hypothetical protein